MGTMCEISKSTLANAKLNVEYVIKGINENLNFKIKRRILELGFFEGETTIVLKKSLQGKTFLISIGECVVSVRKDIAQSVFVEVQ